MDGDFRQGNAAFCFEAGMVGKALIEPLDELGGEAAIAPVYEDFILGGRVFECAVILGLDAETAGPVTLGEDPCFEGEFPQHARPVVETFIDHTGIEPIWTMGL